MAVPENLPSRLGKASKHALHILAASGADQTVQSDHLAAPNPDGDFLKALARKILRPKDFGAKGNRLLVVDLVNGPVDHSCDQPFLVGVGNALRRY